MNDRNNLTMPSLPANASNSSRAAMDFPLVTDTGTIDGAAWYTLLPAIAIICWVTYQQTLDDLRINDGVYTRVSPVYCVAETLDLLYGFVTIVWHQQIPITDAAISILDRSRINHRILPSNFRKLFAVIASIQLIKLSAIHGISWITIWALCYYADFGAIQILKQLATQKRGDISRTATNVPLGFTFTHGRLSPKLPRTADILHWLFLYTVTSRILTKILWPDDIPSDCTDIIPWYIIAPSRVPQNLEDWFTIKLVPYYLEMPVMVLLLLIFPFGPYLITVFAPVFTIVPISRVLYKVLRGAAESRGDRLITAAWSIPLAIGNAWLLAQYPWLVPDVLAKWASDYMCTMLIIVHPSHAFIFGLILVAYVVARVVQDIRAARQRDVEPGFSIPRVENDALANVSWSGVWLVIMVLAYFLFAYDPAATHRPTWTRYLG